MFKKLAKIKFLPNNFQIIEDGDYINCSFRKKDFLRYIELFECSATRGLFFC